MHVNESQLARKSTPHPPVGAVYEDLKELSSAENSPPQLRRGGAKRRGGVGPVIDFLIKPPRRFAAPLLIQGGDIAIFQFILTFYDRRPRFRRVKDRGRS